MSVLVILGLPLIAGVSCALPWRGLAPAATLAASLGGLIASVHLAGTVANAASVTLLRNWIVVDGLSALVLLLIAFVATMAALFSWGYMSASSHEPRRLRLYYANYNLFVFSMLAIPVLAEPTLVWIVVELTTLCSALLVSFENTHEALEAAWKYVVLSLMGAAMALLGFLVLFAAMEAAGGDTYTWGGLVAVAPRMPPVLLKTAFVLILVGLGTKVGLAPMHTWLPDAHSQAPSPVCALLSGVETTSVLYVILRLFPILEAAPAAHHATWAIGFGLFSVGIAAFLLLRVRDYKRMFAFSTVEHMGIILLAAGLGGSAAHYGALYQALSHAMTKSFCFFAAGVVLWGAGTRDIASVRGLIHTSPAAGASLLVGALAIAGAPPFAVFASELSIFRAGLAQGHFVSMGLLAAFIAIGFFGIMLHTNRMVFGPATPRPLGQERLPAACIATLCAGVALVVVPGLYLPGPLYRLLALGAAALGR